MEPVRITADRVGELHEARYFPVREDAHAAMKRVGQAILESVIEGISVNAVGESEAGPFYVVVLTEDVLDLREQMAKALEMIGGEPAEPREFVVTALRNKRRDALTRKPGGEPLIEMDPDRPLGARLYEDGHVE